MVFVLLLAGVLLAGQGTTTGGGKTAQAAVVAPLPSPTATAVVIQNRSPLVNAPPEVIGGASGGANASGNSTPRPNETVLAVKTLDRYIQNAGGDPGSQLRTPMQTQPSGTPVPTGAATGPTGNLAWSGEGTYVTDPFSLEAGTVRVDLTAGVLTMAQLRDQAGTAIGIATAGPQAGGTTIRVPISGAYRLEVWPFGPGPWTVAITYPLAPTVAPTLAPVTANTTAPITVVPSENMTTAATSIPPTATPTEVPTETPTEASAPMPTQSSRTFTGNGNATTPAFTLNQGLASFTSSTTANGTFAVALVGSGETALVSPVTGPFSGSTTVRIPATGSYLLNVTAGGSWEVSIA